MSDEHIIYIVAGKKKERHTGQKWVRYLYRFFFYLIGRGDRHYLVSKWVNKCVNFIPL